MNTNQDTRQSFPSKASADAQGLVENLLDNPAFGFHSIGPNGEFLEMSNTELDWLGYERDEVIGKLRFQDLLIVSDRARFEMRYPIFKEIGIAKDVEYSYLTKKGHVLPISISGTAIKDSSGTFVKTRSIIVDLTLRHQTEAAARRRALQQQREDLVALLAHDLKIPVLGSNRLLDLIMQDQLGPTTSQQKEIFKTMKESNLLVLEKIRTILDIHRYESLDSPIASKKVPLSIVLERCIADCSRLPICWEKELMFECDLLSSSTISVDERAWELLLKNLLRNALSASPKRGRIAVSSKQLADSFQVKIADQGPGIPSGQHDKLFVRFWQGTPNQSTTNTGMGLYLCSKIVSAYGGAISCTSDHGNSCTFVVEMPLRI